MKKIIALILVLLVALPMSLALTSADLINFGKVPRVSSLATSTPTLNMAKVLGIDKLRAWACKNSASTTLRDTGNSGDIQQPCA